MRFTIYSWQIHDRQDINEGCAFKAEIVTSISHITRWQQKGRWRSCKGKRARSVQMEQTGLCQKYSYALYKTCKLRSIHTTYTGVKFNNKKVLTPVIHTELSLSKDAFKKKISLYTTEKNIIFTNYDSVFGNAQIKL